MVNRFVVAANPLDSVTFNEIFRRWQALLEVLRELAPMVPWLWLLSLVHLVLWVSAMLHALLYKRDPRSALGWIGVSLVFPLVGPALYYIFGINRIETSAQQLSLPAPDLMVGYEYGQAGPVTEDPVVPANAGLYPFVSITDKVGSLPLTGANSVRMLVDGAQAYEAMLAAIAEAREFIVLATYIFESDKNVGMRFIDALDAASQRGVAVRVMLDGVGACYSWPRAHRILRRRGIPVARFLPPRLIPPAFHLNLRSHRKILVVDGVVGFTGGMNIGGRHIVDQARNTGTRDLHFRLQGPVVEQLCQVFLEDWRFTTGESPELPCYTLAEPPGQAFARCIRDGPNEDMNKISLTLMGAISVARQSIVLITPYFLPSPGMVASLQSAALRGVDVAILLPARSNLPYVDWATRNSLLELLQYGVKVYYQPPPFPHTKLFIVDDCYAQIGSANIDPRSLRLNFELNMEILGEEAVADMVAYASACRQASRRLPLEEIDRRALPARIRDALFWLFTPYL